MHPYLASAPSPFDALQRAYFWSVVDADHRHADYWREQVAECENHLVSTLHPRTLSSVRESLLRNAMTAAYTRADMVRRVAVRVGFDD